ncbi:ribonuclease H [Flavobacteriaceae bacterium Ap0902]|nr:ribonuclease H [Flavobacteriaceae bacterium Ap0902]
MAKKQKYYVVWKGRKPGIYNNWKECKKQIEQFSGAQYKSFDDLKLAEKAFTESYDQYKGKITTSKKPKLTPEEIAKFGKPIYPSLAVDAAASGNPGKMEYQGVDAKTGKRYFHRGPMLNSTNNIGEFLALVHAISFLKKHQDNRPIYTDSRIAMSWVKAKKARTKLKQNADNQDSFELIARAENWLKNNSYNNPILKWETKAWGEIPADFGRK